MAGTDRDPEERAIYCVLVAAMSPVVVATLIDGDPITGATTLCMLLSVLGLAGLVRSFVGQRSTLPRARVQRSRRRSRSS